MQDAHYRNRQTTEVRVRVTTDTAAMLRRLVAGRPDTISIAVLAGRLLDERVEEMDNSRIIKAGEERYNAVKGDPELRTVLELSKHHTMQQISAMLKLPYKVVAKELGKQVDERHGNDAEDMPHTYGTVSP